jgi:hypothetical protein
VWVLRTHEKKPNVNYTIFWDCNPGNGWNAKRPTGPIRIEQLIHFEHKNMIYFGVYFRTGQGPARTDRRTLSGQSGTKNSRSSGRSHNSYKGQLNDFFKCVLINLNLNQGHLKRTKKKLYQAIV